MERKLNSAVVVKYHRSSGRTALFLNNRASSSEPFVYKNCLHSKGTRIITAEVTREYTYYKHLSKERHLSDDSQNYSYSLDIQHQFHL